MLDDLNLEVRRGEVIALEGPNGVGKTTLAKLIAGLLESDVGSDRALRPDRRVSVQNPGRYLVRERVLDEVALAVDGDTPVRARRSTAWGSRRSADAILRTSRAVSASASDWRPSRCRSPTS